ncbi:class I SAM-dependent methyltransferase [Enterobacillus tribolii]|uniref:Methyltransferase family protein n=1 Tax=Enterobacillus tribolii TaxID=1487935 RepID=A0A370R407_9GAMM|nr:class I SAM-dependent methyltransferase [Enterobacillus tribolii]MBW7984422.1 class I SAM-dependent methyltransferase [Enterobacillus tribolii]RDK97160.1 methyltransferase family protein [Enterobacillus tribolii]
MSHRQNHENNVDRQFGEQAAAYLSSHVHARGVDLEKLQVLLAGKSHAQVLDLGCGAGHVSFTVAPEVAQVTAYDLSASMLAVVAQSAAERKLDNITTRQGQAERLPFGEATFDYVISRYSAHHWQDVGQGMREIGRVLKPGGRVVIIDVCSPGHPLLDTYLQTVEMLRDTSHVRDYSSAEWLQLASDAKLRITGLEHDRLHLEFSSWVARMRTPEALATAIRQLQNAMPREVHHHFEILPDGSFTTDTLFLCLLKPES